MRHYLNSRKVRRNVIISRGLSYGGLGIMAIGLVVSLRQAAPLDAVLGLFFVGMVASQIGLPMRNRWDRHPRIDEVLDSSMKGLDERFAIFHYTLGSSHALFCPGGVFALLPRLEDGKYEYRDGDWIRTWTGRGRLRRGGTRKLGGIDREAAVEAERLRKGLVKKLGLDEAPAVHAFVVFLHSAAEVRSDGAPTPATHLKKLKEAVRKLPKGASLSDSQLARLSGKRA